MQCAIMISSFGRCSAMFCTPHIHIDFDMGVNVADRRYRVSCCEGLAMDVLQSLASDLDFDYRLYISPDSTLGAHDTTTNNWTGMVKELMDGKSSDLSNR